MNETIAQLEQTPRLVRELVGAARDVDHKIGDYFSIRETVAHLRDVDTRGFEIRIRRILAEDHPALADVKGAEIAAERDYATLPLEPELEELERSRAASIALLRTIDDAQLERTAELETVGRVTLRELLERWITHDTEHLAEMRSLA
jgi:nucleoside phosphorylase